MSLKANCSLFAISSLCFLVFIIGIQITPQINAYHAENLPRQVSPPKRSPPSSPGRSSQGGNSPSRAKTLPAPKRVLRSPWIEGVIPPVGGTDDPKNVTVLVEPSFRHSFCGRSSAPQFCTVSPMEPLEGWDRVRWELSAMPIDVIGKCQTQLHVLGRAITTELYVIDSETVGAIKNFREIKQQIREKALGKSETDDGTVGVSILLAVFKPGEKIKPIEADIVLGQNTIAQLKPFYVDFRSDEDIEKSIEWNLEEKVPVTALPSTLVYGEVMDRKDKEQKDGKVIMLMLNPSIPVTVTVKGTAEEYGICADAKPIREQMDIYGQPFNVVKRCIVKLKLGVGSDKPHQIRYVVMHVLDTFRMGFGTVIFGENAFRTFSPLLLDFGK